MKKWYVIFIGMTFLIYLGIGNGMRDLVTCDQFYVITKIFLLLIIIGSIWNWFMIFVLKNHKQFLDIHID
jgi:hypothetical protein